MARRTIPAPFPSAGRTYVHMEGASDLVFFGFHGAANTITNINNDWWVTGNPATTGWHQHAAAHDYNLLLGEAPSGLWNVGGGWPGTQADDQYALDVVDDWTDTFSNVPVGQQRLWAAGFSNGGAMAWRLAALRADYFLGCVTASSWAAVYPTTPIDCWHVHGTGDTTVPIRGGVGVYDVNFPAAAAEGEKAPRGSRVVMYATNGGHGTPGWMADKMLSFATTIHDRP